jgi:hypothetical protein
VIALVVGEEERLVPHDAAAKAAAELLLTQARFRTVAAREELVRVVLLVAEEAVAGAVEVVGARLGEDVDDRAGGASTLGRVHVGLHLHFGDRIHRRAHADRADVTLVVVDAVDEVVVQHVVLPVD